MYLFLENAEGIWIFQIKEEVTTYAKSPVKQITQIYHFLMKIWKDLTL